MNCEPVTAIAADQVVTASETERTVEGIVLPYDAPGATSAGNLTYTKGSIVLPADLGTIKLLDGHSPRDAATPRTAGNGLAVGHAIAAEERDEGLFMRFQLGSSATAEECLVRAREHVVDSFSIEAFILKRRGTKVQRSTLRAVALVPFPAFSDARVEKVTAEDSTEVTADDNPEDSTEDNPKEVTMPLTTPKTDPTDTPAEEVLATYHDAADLIIGIRSGSVDPNSEEVQAALSTLALSESIKTTAPQWLGDIWKSVLYTRQFITDFSTRSLTARKAVGYKLVTPPTVGKWDGTSEITSTAPTWEEVEATAQPWAGGNKIPRPVLDFGEVDRLQRYWELMGEAYAEETDTDFAKAIVEAATEDPKAGSNKAPDILRAVVRGALTVRKNIKKSADVVWVNPEDLESLLQFNKLEVPEFLTDLTPIAHPGKWKPCEHVESGTVIVAHSSAATHYELSGSPLRSRAESVVNGSNDVALFGYTAQIVNRDSAIIKVPFGSDGE